MVEFAIDGGKHIRRNMFEKPDSTHCSEIGLVDFKKFLTRSGMTDSYSNIVGGCFYNLIKNLYSSSSCSIKVGKSQTRSFQYARGVRQGCILSLLLFNLFINNIPYSFENTLSDPLVFPNGTKLNSLLYADDLVILSSSKTDLVLS